jgi:hypothetical protein
MAAPIGCDRLRGAILDANLSLTSITPANQYTNIMRLPERGSLPRLRLTWALRFALLSLILVILLLPALATRLPPRVPRYVSEFQSDLQFEQIAEPGFDADGRARMADSAWSMAYFQPDEATTGYLYVGTDNNIIGLATALLDDADPGPYVQPPQIRRYRPDIGSQAWEVVLDYQDIEEPPYLQQGFRVMTPYRARTDQQLYLYAGTMAAHNPVIWRSTNGDPGTWEQVFSFPQDNENLIGSVRGMVAHIDGLLYVSTTGSGDILPGGLGQIWATDGSTFTSVINDGFGSANNTGIASMASFNGCLYAGTYNAITGYEIWKLRCLNHYDAPPELIIREGAGNDHMEVAMSMRVFQDHLYIGTGIPLGFNPSSRHGPKGCNVVRIDSSDSVEIVVGQHSAQPVSGYRPGFGWYLNAYCWYMKEHDGHLYLGTWDLSRTLNYLGNHPQYVTPPLRPLLSYLEIDPENWGSPIGGDLYRSVDGIYWEPVFLDGLGNHDNHGIRTLESTPMGLFIGTENPFTRLEVWVMRE